MLFIVPPIKNGDGPKCPNLDPCPLYVKPCPKNAIYILPPIYM